VGYSSWSTEPQNWDIAKKGRARDIFHGKKKVKSERRCPKGKKRQGEEDQLDGGILGIIEYLQPATKRDLVMAMESQKEGKPIRTRPGKHERFVVWGKGGQARAISATAAACGANGKGVSVTSLASKRGNEEENKERSFARYQI